LLCFSTEKLKKGEKSGAATRRFLSFVCKNSIFPAEILIERNRLEAFFCEHVIFAEACGFEKLARLLGIDLAELDGGAE
jgi:hypothetical protein